ncbi:MAG TPA: ribonuclease Y [Mycobacteriales bacterium]|nr:ribonuclease Y [Mycobacteriales bacterium]
MLVLVIVLIVLLLGGVGAWGISTQRRRRTAQRSSGERPNAVIADDDSPSRTKSADGGSDAVAAAAAETGHATRSADSHDTGDPTSDPDSNPGSEPSDVEAARSEALIEIQAMRLQAIHAAASTRAEAETLAAMAKRIAEAEAESTRRAAQKELEETRQALQAETENSHRRAELEASNTILQARRTAEQEAERATAALRSLQTDVERREQRIVEREERVDSDRTRLETRSTELTEREQALAEQDRLLTERAEEHRRELERIGGLATADARAELLTAVETEVKRDAAIIIRDTEAQARATADHRARKIVADTIQRIASEQTAESVVSVLHLPSDEMKGRIIGREGRNIRAFESVTGVNVIIDDTPEAVLLSCFDPVRREIGRLTLDKLILDGRIHPQRIEEIHEQSKVEIEQLCLRAAEDAVIDVGIGPLHPDLLVVLGRLRYRTSYGQNVLAHLIECAHIAELMAAELGVDPVLVKRGAFLHDIGKALTHEVPGSHALLGADLARRYGEPDDVVHAIEAHHNEVQPQTIEAVLTQAADGCSGGRPGARRESLESYVQRLERIEEIASSRPGVEKVFAMQAGREVRVMVSPDEVDDLGAAVLARDVAKQIEADLTYPGQIRVTVVRESRATEVAR